VTDDEPRAVLRSRSTVDGRDWGDGCRAWDLVHRPELRVTSETMPPRTVEVPHRHDRARQVFLVHAGRLTLVVGEVAIAAGPGEAVEVAPGVVHQARNGGDGPLEFTVVSTPTTEGDRRDEGTALAPPATGVARPATLDDVEELVRLRGVMFEAMGLDLADRSWVDDATTVIRTELAAGRLFARVVEHSDGAGLVAAGIAQVTPRIPSPGAPGRWRAYISSVATDPAWRRRGLARAVLTTLVADADERGVDVLELHATGEGRPLYEALGFVERTDHPELRRLRPG